MIDQRDRVAVYRGSGGELKPVRSPQRSSWPPYSLAYALLATIAICVVWLNQPNRFVAAPAIALLGAALSVTLAFACGGQEYVHHRFTRHNFVQHNEVGGFIIAVAGTLYSVLLGFLTVVAWQQFSDARQLVAMESAAATDVWHAAVGIPMPERARVRRDILLYATSMARDEWPAMRGGRFDKRADYLVMDAMSAAGTLVPTNQAQSNSQNATVAQLSVLHDDRQRRLAENASGISAFEWLVLLLGAGCIIAFCWLFGLENHYVHLLMTSSVTILMTSVLVLLFELQYPFRTDLRIGPDSWTAAVKHIYIMQNGSQLRMRM